MKPLLRCCALSLVCLNGFGDTISLTPIADTTISEDNAAIFTSHPGTMVAGALSGGEKVRALLRFDLTTIPTNGTVTSATLAFTVTQSAAPFTPAAFELHRLSTAWTEAGATWETSDSSASWPSGGDFRSTIDASVNVTGAGSYIFPSTAASIATVQGWLQNPDSNNGWIIINGDEDTFRSARRFAARDFATTSSRPQLTITYTAPAPQPVITNVASENGVFRFNFTVQPDVAYRVEFKNSLSVTNWQTLTNIAAGSATTIAVSDTVLQSQRYYRVLVP